MKSLITNELSMVADDLWTDIDSVLIQAWRNIYSFMTVADLLQLPLVIEKI